MTVKIAPSIAMSFASFGSWDDDLKLFLIPERHPLATGIEVSVSHPGMAT